MRIVRLASFVMARSGGLRTALRYLGEGYAAAGHEPVLVVPGAAESDVDTPYGRVVTLSGPVVPATGGYRVLIGRRRLARLRDALRPDRLEVSDRFTLRWTGSWARARGVPAVLVSHESLTGLLRVWRVPAAHLLADARRCRLPRGARRPPRVIMELAAARTACRAAHSMITREHRTWRAWRSPSGGTGDRREPESEQAALGCPAWLDPTAAGPTSFDRPR